MSMYDTDERQLMLQQAPEGSTWHELSTLPVVNDVPLAIGQVLYLPRTGLVVVPVETRSPGYRCTVVMGNDTYPVGGYDLYICPDEIVRARPLDVAGMKAAQRLADAALSVRTYPSNASAEFVAACDEWYRIRHPRPTKETADA